MSSFAVIDPAGIELGEHPLWDARRERVGWIDVHAGQLRWLDGGRLDTWQFPPPLGAAALRRSGGVVGAAGDGIHFRDALGLPDREPLTGFLPDAVRFNDAACDPAGNFLCGTTSVRGERARGSLYRVGPDGEIETLIAGVTESNGLAWSPDGGTLYYVDSGEPAVRRYRYHPRSKLVREPDLCAVPPGDGVPDGLCVDATGAVWVALWEGSMLWRVADHGEILEVLETPVSRPTCPGFGGDGWAQLFVSTAWEGMTEPERRSEPWAGHLLAHRPVVPGAAAHAFAG